MKPESFKTEFQEKLEQLRNKKSPVWRFHKSGGILIAIDFLWWRQLKLKVKS